MTTRKLREYRDRVKAIDDAFLNLITNQLTPILIDLRAIWQELDREIKRQERKQAVFRIETGENEEDASDR